MQAQAMTDFGPAGEAAVMVKVFGRRPSQVAHVGMGRRTKTFTAADILSSYRDS